MFGNGFYNPYTYQPYYQTANMTRNLGGLARTANIGGAGINTTVAGKTGLAGLLSKFSFSGFLNGASKTLNVVNQAIPIFYQVKPIINNAKTMFRIMGAVKDDDHSKKNTVNNSKNYNNTSNRTSSNTVKSTATQNISASKTEFPTENPVFFI